MDDLGRRLADPVLWRELHAGGLGLLTLLEADPEGYADVVGGGRADEVDFREEHHGQEEGRVPTSVEVVSIVEVHCRYRVPPGATDKVNHPVQGTTVLVASGVGR